MLAVLAHVARRCRSGTQSAGDIAASLSVAAGRSQLQVIEHDDLRPPMQLGTEPEAVASCSSSSTGCWPAFGLRGYAGQAAEAAKNEPNAKAPRSIARRLLLTNLLREHPSVPGDSVWLEAYKKNIHPRHLTYRLGKRGTLKELSEGWELYQEHCDTIAMAALLRRVRVAQLYDPAFDPAAAQQLVDAVEQRLRRITLRFGRLRDTVAYLHALAKLRSPAPPQPSNSSSTSNAPVVNTVNSPPGHPVDLVLDLALWSTRTRSEVLQCNPRRLATLLWVLTRLVPEAEYGNEKLQAVLDRVTLCTLNRMPNFAPLDLRVFALAFATLGPAGERGGAAGAGAGSSGSSSSGSSSGGSSGSGGVAGPGLRGARGWELAEQQAEALLGQGAGQGAEGRRLRNAKMMQALATELAARYGNLAVPQPDARDMALAAHATAVQYGMQPPHLPLMTKAAAAAAAALPSPSSPGVRQQGQGQLAAEEAVLLVEALAAAGVRHPGLLDAVRQRAGLESQGGFDEGQLRRLGVAFQRLGQKL